MYAWRYLLLSLPSAGLLAPVGLAWTLGRFAWKPAGLSLALALLLWLLAAWYPYFWTALLWFAGLVGLNAWIAGGLCQPAVWLRSAGLVFSHVLLVLGLALLGLALVLVDPAQLDLSRDHLWWLGGGMSLAGLVGMELIIRRWRCRDRT
jgi:hypothetical protein